MIIQTSRLGHDISVYDVETNATPEDLKQIDRKYGMKSRTEWTDITQLEEGAIKEGFTFKIKEQLLKNSTDFKAYRGKYDYEGNYGNY
jgi:hypothetical protein